ncbi:MAG: type II toxin-antitoxin system antitoxin SocA domain-containing protein [Patescibacteria group bacterium]
MIDKILYIVYTLVMIGKFIQKQRKTNGISQEYLAKELGISRPTYIQMELNKKDPTLTQAQKLADIFGISFNDFILQQSPSPIVKIEKEKKPQIKEREEIRISVPQRKLDKFKEVLVYILSKIGAEPQIGETALYKILYFIDFDYYEKYEEQLIGATYIKNHYGPTPVEFKTIVDDMIKKGELQKVEGKYFSHSQKKYLPVRQPDLTKLKSARELKHIDEVLARLSHMNANELSNYSHEDVPWIVAQEGKPLNYEAVFYRTHKTSVRAYGNTD